MSDQHGGSTNEQFEIIGAPVRAPRGPRRKHVAGLAVAAVAVAAVGAGVWAWQAWSAQGPQPAEALPGNTLAYVALDFDPPGQQKVAAFDTLRKFPSLKEDFGSNTPEAVRKSVVEDITSQSGCDIDYARLVKPWIGDRIAFAVVDQSGPQPVFVVQAKDVDKARSSLRSALGSCDRDSFGYAVKGDWVVLAGSADVATRTTTDAARRALSDDADFKRLTKAAGDPGLATLYAAPEAGPALLDAIDQDPWLGWMASYALNEASDPLGAGIGVLSVSFLAEPVFSEGSSSAPAEPEISPELRAKERKLAKRMQHFDELSKQEQKQLIDEQQQLFEQEYGSQFPNGGGDVGSQGNLEGDFESASDGPTLSPKLRSSLEHFTGLGGTARFDGGALEVDLVSDLLQGTTVDLYAGHDGDKLLADVPAGTAVAYDLGLADGWGDSLMDLITQEGAGGSSRTDTVKAFEKATGLDVPGDLEALGGDNVVLVAGSGFDPNDLADDTSHAAVAARVSGDPDRIEAALDKLRATVKDPSYLQSKRVGDDVLIGPDAAYLDDLAKVGDDLEHSDRFQRVVPGADDATTVLYVDFDAGNWASKLANASDRKDVEPLDTLGMTMTKDGDQQRLQLRVTFD